MISFIVIGKNIEKTIKLCLDSIELFINLNNINDYEIIYVDSDSNDCSLKIAKKYSIKVIKITGSVNAAIGRNVGAKHSKGETLFFLDGDMELLPDVFSIFFDINKNKLKTPFARGFQKHKVYDGKFNLLYTIDEKLPVKPIERNKTGGLFIIDRTLWFMVGGMDERLIRNQDVDFGLRMSKSGYKILFYNKYFIIHHTSDYFEKSRLWKFLLSKALLSPGIVMRKHLFNIEYLKIYKDKVLYNFLLILVLMIFPISGYLSTILFLLYIFIQLIRTLKTQRNGKQFINIFIYNFFYNIYSFVGFLFYYPKKPEYSFFILK